MRILIDGEIFNLYPFGGIARYFREVLPRIAENNDDIKIYIFCNESAVSKLPKHDRIYPIYCKLSHFWPFQISSRFNNIKKWFYDRRIKYFKSDIFHTTFYTFSPCENIKSVVTVYDLIDYEYSFMMTNGPKFVQLQSDILTQADHVISISESTTEIATSAFNLDKNKVTTIYLDASSVFKPLPDSDKSTFREKYSRGRPFFLFVGATYSYKNLATLIRALGIIRESTDHLLILAGHSKKNTEQAHVDLAIEHQVVDRIVRLIHPDDDILCQAYNAADAFIFPSLQEGFGIPLIEAMRCDTPIIAADIPVFKEICGDAALFFNPCVDIELAECLLSVLDPVLRSKKISLGQERDKLFSWDKAAKQIEAVYANLKN